jgi:hypothetical protein
MRAGSAVKGTFSGVRLAGKGAIIGSAITAPYNVYQLAQEIGEGIKAHHHLRTHARGLGKRGYKVTTRPTWRGMLRGDPGLKITKKR